MKKILLINKLKLITLRKIKVPINPNDAMSTKIPDVAIDVPILEPNIGDFKNIYNEWLIDHILAQIEDDGLLNFVTKYWI